MKDINIHVVIFITTSLLLCMVVLIGCSNKKEKKPANFFSHIGDIISGKSNEVREQVGKDIQVWLDKGHPELGLKVIAARSMASLHSGNFDNYEFAVIDSTGLRFIAIWNNYAEQAFGGIEHQKQVPYRDFMEGYEKAVLYKSYTDTLQSKLPEDIRTEIFYRPQSYWEEPDDYMRFYIFSSEYRLNAERKVYLVENIRKALRETVSVFDKRQFEASLCFVIPEKSSIGDGAVDMRAEKSNYIWLAAEIRDEDEIPDFVLAGKESSKLKEAIKENLTGNNSYTYPEYLLIRQDDFSELFYMTATETTDESRTFVYGIYTYNMVLKEKKEIVISREKGYKYKEIEEIIPDRFRYRYMPDKSVRSPINPFYNPYHNLY